MPEPSRVTRMSLVGGLLVAVGAVVVVLVAVRLGTRQPADNRLGKEFQYHLPASATTPVITPVIDARLRK